MNFFTATRDQHAIAQHTVTSKHFDMISDPKQDGMKTRDGATSTSTRLTYDPLGRRVALRLHRQSCNTKIRQEIPGTRNLTKWTLSGFLNFERRFQGPMRKLSRPSSFLSGVNTSGWINPNPGVVPQLEHITFCRHAQATRTETYCALQGFWFGVC